METRKVYYAELTSGIEIYEIQDEVNLLNFIGRVTVSSKRKPNVVYLCGYEKDNVLNEIYVTNNLENALGYVVNFLNISDGFIHEYKNYDDACSMGKEMLTL